MRGPQHVPGCCSLGGHHCIPCTFQALARSQEKRNWKNLWSFYGFWAVYGEDCLWQWVPQTAPYRRCFGQDKDIPVIPGKGLSRPSHGGLILTASSPGCVSSAVSSWLVSQGAGGYLLLDPWVVASVGQGGLCLAPAELIAAEQPLSTLRDWVYGEKFQPAAGVLSHNCFLMGGS